MNEESLKFESYMDFHKRHMGKYIVFRGRVICRSAAYWGLMSGGITERELEVKDKPGWSDGVMVNHPEYLLWFINLNY